MSWDIDYSKCIKCNQCVSDCVACALIMTEKGAALGPAGEKGCIKCQHCLAICPAGAISIDGVNPEKCAKLPDITEKSFEELSSIIRNRHSIRKFSSTPVDKATIEKILNEVHFMPSGCNCRGLKFIVISDPAKIEELRKYYIYKSLEAINNQTLPAGLQGLFGSMKGAMENNIDVFFRGAPNVIYVATHKYNICPEDVTIALSHFELLANSLNIGTTWFGLGDMFSKFIDPDFGQMLGLDSNYSIAHPMIFGYPQVKYLRQTDKKPFPVKYVDPEV